MQPLSLNPAWERAMLSWTLVTALSAWPAYALADTSLDVDPVQRQQDIQMLALLFHAIGPAEKKRFFGLLGTKTDKDKAEIFLTLLKAWTDGMYAQDGAYEQKVLASQRVVMYLEKHGKNPDLAAQQVDALLELMEEHVQEQRLKRIAKTLGVSIEQLSTVRKFMQAAVAPAQQQPVTMPGTIERKPPPGLPKGYQPTFIIPKDMLEAANDHCQSGTWTVTNVENGIGRLKCGQDDDEVMPLRGYHSNETQQPVLH